MTKIWYRVVGAVSGEEGVDVGYVEDYDATIEAWKRGEPFQVRQKHATEMSWVRGSQVAEIGKVVKQD